MPTAKVSPEIRPQARQALTVWIAFILVAVAVNGTILFALGADLHSWTYSTEKAVLVSVICYGLLFLVVPLILTKGWKTVRQPAFSGGLLVAIAGVALWPFVPLAACLVVFALAYLHWRFDLSELGIRSRGWKEDLAAILLVGLAYSLPHVPSLLSDPLSLSFYNALMAGLYRWFANPASSAENLFYFGFLTDRLSQKTGKWVTPILIAAMYTAHEMSNPEYWYEGMSFGLIFVGITIMSAIYLWRRSTVVTWLSDGFGQFMANLF